MSNVCGCSAEITNVKMWRHLSKTVNHKQLAVKLIDGLKVVVLLD